MISSLLYPAKIRHLSWKNRDSDADTEIHHSDFSFVPGNKFDRTLAFFLQKSENVKLDDLFRWVRWVDSIDPSYTWEKFAPPNINDLSIKTQNWVLVLRLFPIELFDCSVRAHRASSHNSFWRKASIQQFLPLVTIHSMNFTWSQHLHFWATWFDKYVVG